MMIVDSALNPLLSQCLSTDSDVYETLGEGCRRRRHLSDPDFGDCPDDESFDYEEFENETF